MTHVVDGRPAPLPGGVVRGHGSPDRRRPEAQRLRADPRHPGLRPPEGAGVTFDLTGKVAIVTGRRRGSAGPWSRASPPPAPRWWSALASRSCATRSPRRSRRPPAPRSWAWPATSATGTPSPPFVEEGRRAFRPHRCLGQQRRHHPPGRRRRDDPRLLAQDLLGQPRGPAADEPVCRPRHARRRRRQHHQHRHHGRVPPGSASSAYGASKAALLNLSRTWPRSGRIGRCGSTRSPWSVRQEMVDGAERNAPASRS